MLILNSSLYTHLLHHITAALPASDTIYTTMCHEWDHQHCSSSSSAADEWSHLADTNGWQRANPGQNASHRHHCQLSHLNTMVTSSLGIGGRCDELTWAFLRGVGQLIKAGGLGQWASEFTMTQLHRASLWLAVVCGLGQLAQGTVLVFLLHYLQPVTAEAGTHDNATDYMGVATTVTVPTNYSSYLWNDVWGTNKQCQNNSNLNLATISKFSI